MNTPLRSSRSLPVLIGALVFLLLSHCSNDRADPTVAKEPEIATSGAQGAVKRPQVVIIAVDGLEPTLLDSMMQAGKLQNIQRLVARGSVATIDPVTVSISPVVWTTVATGVSPERHGITDFTVDDQLVTSTMRRVAAFWNVLPRYDRSSAVLGWMVTWPAEKESGIIVSDRAYWGNFDDKVAPVGIIKPNRYHYDGKPDPGILDRFTDYPYDPDFEDLSPDDPRYAVNFLLKKRLLDIYVHDSTFGRIAADVMDGRSPDVLAVYFQGADYVSHGFWKYFQPQPFRAEGWHIDQDEVRQLGDVIPRYYGYLDRLIGTLMTEVEKDALVILLSDHGFGPGLGKYRVGGDYLSGNHRPDGVLILSGPQVVDGMDQTRRITHYDILPTMLYALDVPIARDLEGQPLLQYFENSFLAGRDVSFVSSYPFTDEDGSGAVESDQDKEILDELRSLGYIN